MVNKYSREDVQKRGQNVQRGATRDPNLNLDFLLRKKKKSGVLPGAH